MTLPVGAVVEIVREKRRGVITERPADMYPLTEVAVEWEAGQHWRPMTQSFQDSWLDDTSVRVVEGRWGAWDAPATDHLPAIPTPVGLQCTYCRQPITAHDKGGAVTRGMGPHHRECALRAVMGGIGHHVDHAKYCNSKLGPDGGLSYRDSALLVWDIYVEHRTITEALLSARRDQHGPEGH